MPYLRRGLISVFLLYHLFVIGFGPNQDSVITRRAETFIRPYMNFFEFTALWSFFAPEPGPAPIFLEWEMQGAQGEDLGTGRFPEYQHSYFFWDRQNRRVAIAYFMFGSDERYTRIWGDYVCRNHPEAASIRLWRMMLEVPAREEVAEGRKSVADFTVANRQSSGQVFCADLRSSLR